VQKFKLDIRAHGKRIRQLVVEEDWGSGRGGGGLGEVEAVHANKLVVPERGEVTAIRGPADTDDVLRETS
jgi:hypothetical protein